MAKRKFTKYPSNYVKASWGDSRWKDYADIYRINFSYESHNGLVPDYSVLVIAIREEDAEVIADKLMDSLGYNNYRVEFARMKQEIFDEFFEPQEVDGITFYTRKQLNYEPTSWY